MGKHYYILRIYTEESNYEKVSSILGLQLMEINKKFPWQYEIESEEQDGYFDFINIFLDVLEGKYDKLFELGIERESISIVMYYAYADQCNIEFGPNELKRLGENEIGLSISCWDKANDNDLRWLDN